MEQPHDPSAAEANLAQEREEFRRAMKEKQMTPDIPAIREALKSATPGPWTEHMSCIRGLDGEFVANGRMFDEKGSIVSDPNLNLIVLLRNNIEALLDERKRLLAVVEAARRVNRLVPDADENPEGYQAGLDALLALRAALDALEGK